MALTNFAQLTGAQATVWARDVWKTARQASFIMSTLAGKGMNAPIERITELTSGKGGTQARITCVPDLEGDGVVGDTPVEGNEEAAQAYEQAIFVDQLRNANRLKGRMADQKSVVKFRGTSRDLLGFWLGDRVDQLAALTAAGIDPRVRTNGALRPGFGYAAAGFSRDLSVVPVGKALVDLEFITSDATAAAAGSAPYADRMSTPSGKRWFVWSGGKLVAVDPAAVNPWSTDPAITSTDTPSYAMLVELKAYAKDRRIRPLRGSNGRELYHILMHPKAIARLKLDKDFKDNVRSAGARGPDNPLFTGAIETVDGLVIHEFTHLFNTLGAAAGTSTNAGWAGFKWGANANVDGSTVLLFGAQGLGFADLGIPEWDERDHFDYGAQPGIAVSKICGFRKPQFYSPMDGTVEDFGTIRVDVAI